MSFLLLCVGLRPHRFTIRLKMRIFSGVVLREKKVQKNQMGESGSTPGDIAIRPSFDNGQGAAGLVDGEQVFQGYTQQAADPYTNDANMGDYEHRAVGFSDAAGAACTIYGRRKWLVFDGEKAPGGVPGAL
jgi:hypothetical protein